MTKAPTPMGTSVKAPVVKHAPSAPAESVPEIPADGVHKLTKVVIITRQNKLDEFMQAMNEIGVTGITITNVMGCGCLLYTSRFVKLMFFIVFKSLSIKTRILYDKIRVFYIFIVQFLHFRFSIHYFLL